MAFKDIDFGKSAAENEPDELLIKGFWDNYGHVNKLINESKYLILGSKGSGKSAIGRKLELLAKEEKNFHASMYNFSDFPYKLFSSLIKNKESLEIKYQNDWEYLLLVVLLNRFMEEKNFIKNNPDAENIINAFENIGIMANSDLTQIVKNTANTELGLNYVANLSKSSQTDKVPFSISMIYESLKKVCYEINIKSKHFIVIDGLDDVLSGSDKQFTLLAALILVVDRMNSRFRERGIDAKIIVLCRTDLFNKFPGSNNNKIKQDSSILLDWYQEKDIKSTNLVKLINLRAKLSLGKEIDVFEDIFPKKISRYKETTKYLFEYTRHTPRDLIALLNKIQDATKGDNPTKSEIWTGIDNYSIDYFLTEINDELKGFLTSEEIEKATKLLSMMRTTKFKETDIVEKVKFMKGYMMLDIEKILNQLFECNSIGNIDENNYMSFKCRNTHSFFMTDEFIIIHKGLWKALNLKVGAYRSHNNKK